MSQEIDIAIGLSASSKTWKNTRLTWDEFISRLKTPVKTSETFKAFINASKSEQSKIKDVGGYVGGYLQGSRRKHDAVIHRQVLTLDVDFAKLDFWLDFILMFGNEAIMHSTHKHCNKSPRYRLIMPLSRECTPDEYVAIARYVAGCLDIEMFDKTTFDITRLMFWPSVPSDSKYVFEHQSGSWLDADYVLSQYVDWRDATSWPRADKETIDNKNDIKKQENPLSKRGAVGAFCRTYTIADAISTFLSDDYVKVDTDRYTYVKGTTSSGLVVYDNLFAYSHHGSDPASGLLCNAFDLVRIHMFRHLDENDEDNTGSKSYAALEKLVYSDKNVKETIAVECLENAKYDFVSESTNIEELAKDTTWMRDLETDQKGKYLSSSFNVNLIFANDVLLKKKFRYNDFDRKKYVFGELPWRKTTGTEVFRNVDLSGVRNYIETIYGITGAMKIEDSLALEFEKNHYHPVLEYITGLKWDGINRIDTALIDYFGAQDNTYTREAFRKMLVGAIARIIEPGVKFDLVLTLISPQQGTGKSSFLRALGKNWFSDTFTTVQGKEAFEQIQGAWLIELAELSGLRKADIEATKHFITKQIDTFRPAYGKESETFKRQCVFAATTNESAFLRDATGNRRFMPVDVHDVKLIDNEALMGLINSPETIDQFWAEAYQLYLKGEKLYLSASAEIIGGVERHRHVENDERLGLIEEYLDKKLPLDWGTMSIFDRKRFLEDSLSAEGEAYRDYVCIAEIWCECLGRGREDMDKYKTREINDIMKRLPGWTYVNSTKNFKLYGTQKYYIRNLI